ncbi:MAG: ABC transporter ATP-binding protein [Acidimicrobiia bacterium]
MTRLLAETVDLTKRYGDITAVDGVSISVSAGEVVGLVGANGAGKTTLIRMLLGIIPPDQGRVRLLGEPPTRAVRRHIGYMPQGMGLYADLTVEENLQFTAQAFGIPTPRLDEDLLPLAGAPIQDLPLGLRRRVAFVAALAHRPDLLVLDEPTSGVGPLGRAELWETIHEAADSGGGVLVTTHHMDEAEQCDRLMFLSAGREAASGTVEEILEGRLTTEVSPADPAEALIVLEDAGLPVLPAGPRLRLPGVPISAARSALGNGSEMIEKQSSLEEAFMTLVAAS